MNAFLAVLLLAVSASCSHIIPVQHHVPSGSVSVGHNGAVIAGPSGSVHTDNGLHGHGAGARLSGPAGDVRTHGGHVELDGPGIGHGHGHGHVVAPVVHHVPVVQHVPVVHHVQPVAIVAGHHGISHGLVGHGGLGHGLVGLGVGHGLVGHHHGW